MKNRIILRLAALMLLCAVLGGCAMTVDQMYRIPRRSERYEDLQAQIDSTMGTMTYSAPVSGENRQAVQMADLDGDGENEIIAFAKGTNEDPMKLLIFSPLGDGFEMRCQLESAGSAFDQVEYAQVDGQPGLELIVGHQLSDQLMRNVSVYSFSGDTVRVLMSGNYMKLLTCDLNEDQLQDLFLIQPGHEDGDNAFAVLYSVLGGEVVRSAETELSVPVGNLKRIITGPLDSGENAVYVASKAGEKAILTDIFALVDGSLRNVALSSEDGTSVQTLRNYYVYSDDIDRDGVVELPALIDMPKLAKRSGESSQHLICWYAMRASGEKVTKMYTYHNFADGWFLELEEDFSRQIRVEVDENGGYAFHLHNHSTGQTKLLFTVYTLTGEERMNVARQEELQEILKTDHVVYAARMGDVEELQIEQLRERFRLIQIYWNTGEM